MYSTCIGYEMVVTCLHACMPAEADQHSLLTSKGRLDMGGGCCDNRNALALLCILCTAPSKRELAQLLLHSLNLLDVLHQHSCCLSPRALLHASDSAQSAAELCCGEQCEWCSSPDGGTLGYGTIAAKNRAMCTGF